MNTFWRRKGKRRTCIPVFVDFDIRSLLSQVGKKNEEGREGRVYIPRLEEKHQSQDIRVDTGNFDSFHLSVNKPSALAQP
jgi:hypothetical protein